MAKADLQKKPEKWGINELMRFLFVCMASSPAQKITVRKDVLKAVPENFLFLMEVVDIGHSYMLKLPDRAKDLSKKILIPRGGIWTPSGG